jgi:general stress protein 13
MNKYKVGDIVTGKVTGIEKYGFFVSIDDNVAGLVHISEISGSFVRNVSDYAEVDEVVKAKIIDVDPSNTRLKLSVKNLEYRDSSKYIFKIVETKNGFNGLRKALPNWILSKEKSSEEKNKKN